MLKIAFIVGKFPTLSETFILNQITGLIDLGHNVQIFAKSESDDLKIHKDIKRYKLLEKTTYMIDVPENIIRRILKAVYLIIINFHKNPILILKSINFFKFKKEALSLSLLYLTVPFLSDKFDIIQCHFGKNGLIGSKLKKVGLRGRLFTMFHGNDIRLGLKKGGNIYNELIKYGDTGLAISNYNYENLVKFGFNPKKIVYHPVGIDVNRFSKKKNYSFNKHKGTIEIITIARLVKEKGIQYGIKSIATILNSNPNLKLKYSIIGDGYLKKELKILVNKLNLESVVVFLGEMYQDEIIKQLKKSNIFLLPSINEALPVVLMEAQAIGIPVIATSVGSVKEIVLDGKSGFLVPKKNVKILSEKLEYLINHSEDWIEMGKSGRVHIERHYDINKLNKRLVSVYKKSLESNEDML